MGEFFIGKIIISKIFFVLYDLMGIVLVDEIKFSKWCIYEVMLKVCLKKVKFIVLCRKYILKDGRVKSFLMVLKFNLKFVDIS